MTETLKIGKHYIDNEEDVFKVLEFDLERVVVEWIHFSGTHCPSRKLPTEAYIRQHEPKLLSLYESPLYKAMSESDDD